MKLLPIVLFVAVSPTFAQTSIYGPFSGTPTVVGNNNPSAWLGGETTNRANELVGANYAWSRGWTGKGSTIMIMDTGIDVGNVDFAGKIKYQFDLTRTGMQDQVGHGTNVAGIAAAARNGIGVNGVAFDANLAIAKLSNTSNVTSGQAVQALNWAKQYSDITVANFSANTSYSTAYTKSVTQIAPGIYASSDKNYGGKNYYNLEKPETWAQALGPNTVLTVSAGNSNLPYVQNPATFASATDVNGKLVLNGQMLVVGNWNAQAGRIEGARSGSVCKDVVGGTCRDTYRVSDFYILAPGMSVSAPAINTTETKSMSGTSQAAPVVAGAVAIINQLWPYMTPENQVQVLLKTANKNLPGYNVDTHGQGLLDLDAATRPIGAVNLSMTGRTGKPVPVTGTIVVAGSGAGAKASLSSISVIDSMQRDFKADMSGAVHRNTLMSNPVMLDAEPGYNWSGRWSGMGTEVNPTHYVTGAQAPGSDSTVTFDSRMLDPKATTVHQFTLTSSQNNPYVALSGTWGRINNSVTTEYSQLNMHESGVWTQVGGMITNVGLSNGIVNNISSIVAMHAAVGVQLGNFNWYAGIKPTVVHGAFNMTLPTNVDEQGVMSYSNVRVSLAGTPATYVGVKWQQDITKNSKFSVRGTVDQEKNVSARIFYTISL